MFLVVVDKHLNIEHCFTFGKSSLAILCLSFSPRRLLLCLIWPAGHLKEENIYKKRWNGPFGPKDGPTCQICVFRIRVRRHRRCIIIKLFPKAWTSRFWPPPPQYNLIFMQFVKKKNLGIENRTWRKILNRVIYRETSEVEDWGPGLPYKRGGTEAVMHSMQPHGIDLIIPSVLP